MELPRQSCSLCRLQAASSGKKAEATATVVFWSNRDACPLRQRSDPKIAKLKFGRPGRIKRPRLRESVHPMLLFYKISGSLSMLLQCRSCFFLDADACTGGMARQRAILSKNAHIFRQDHPAHSRLPLYESGLREALEWRWSGVPKYAPQRYFKTEQDAPTFPIQVIYNVNFVHWDYLM